MRSASDGSQDEKMQCWQEHYIIAIGSVREYDIKLEQKAGTKRTNIFTLVMIVVAHARGVTSS